MDTRLADQEWWSECYQYRTQQLRRRVDGALREVATMDARLADLETQPSEVEVNGAHQGGDGALREEEEEEDGGEPVELVSVRVINVMSKAKTDIRSQGHGVTTLHWDAPQPVITTGGINSYINKLNPYVPAGFAKRSRRGRGSIFCL